MRVNQLTMCNCWGATFFFCYLGKCYFHYWVSVADGKIRVVPTLIEEDSDDKIWGKIRCPAVRPIAIASVIL